MDLQDLQDDRRSDYQFGEITEEIILPILSIHVHSFCSKTYARCLAHKFDVGTEWTLAPSGGWHRVEVGTEWRWALSVEQPKRFCFS